MNTKAKYDVNSSDDFEKFLRNEKKTCWNNLNTAQRKEAAKEFKAACAAQ